MIAHRALEDNISLFDAVSSDADIAEYFSKFSDSEMQILKEPEKYYTGLAAQKAHSVYDAWQSQF